MTSDKISLHELGLKYGTDKAAYHQFTFFYDKYFTRIREEKLNVLEIGVHNGSSIKMLEEYFKNSKIYGVDIVDKSYLNNNRIEILTLNQESISDLNNFPKNLDIIIDDGGHTMKQQQLSFVNLFTNNLKSDGYYIIEDLHTSFNSYYHSHGSDDKNNTLRLLNDLSSGILSEQNEYFISKEQFIHLIHSIKCIEIYMGPDKTNSVTSIIIKR
jgi:hypothetical protein